MKWTSKFFGYTPMVNNGLKNILACHKLIVMEFFNTKWLSSHAKKTLQGFKFFWFTWSFMLELIDSTLFFISILLKIIIQHTNSV
jgi:hypothetical protein